jgi:hypothetical protein
MYDLDVSLEVVKPVEASSRAITMVRAILERATERLVALIVDVCMASQVFSIITTV